MHILRIQYILYYYSIVIIKYVLKCKFTNAYNLKIYKGNLLQQHYSGILYYTKLLFIYYFSVCPIFP